MEWLRVTARRTTPMWLRVVTVVIVVAVFLVVRSLVDLTVIQAALVGGITAGIIATVAKLVWAAMNPLSNGEPGVNRWS
jgi:hypothetical protein